MKSIFEKLFSNLKYKKELAVNIHYCPFCGRNVIEAVSKFDMYCMDCGKDFKIMNK